MNSNTAYWPSGLISALNSSSPLGFEQKVECLFERRVHIANLVRAIRQRKEIEPRASALPVYLNIIRIEVSSRNTAKMRRRTAPGSFTA